MLPPFANRFESNRFRWEQVIFSLFIAACLTCSAAVGDITMPKVFSDHMVLQRNSGVEIWGKAEPAQKLVVSFIDFKTEIQADSGGNWSTMIQTPDAGGPFQLEVAALEGEPKVVFTDVMIGEVWVASGQCNMAFPMSNVLNPETEIEMAKNYPNLRLFTVAKSASPQPLEDFVNVTPWSICTPDSVKSFSATAYFFGRELSKQLDGIPIGLIHSSQPHTPIESWTSKAAMDQVESLSPLLRYWKENDDPASTYRPANMYNGMIAPLTKVKVRGAIWYQGEANVSRGHQYATLFPTMIQDWRNAFRNPEFPIYFVQLTPYQYEDKPEVALAEVWDAQLRTLKTVKNTGMVVTTDIGKLNDNNPKNKQLVGHRLALLALGNTYKESLPEEKRSIISSGPIYESIATNGDQIRVTFQHAGEGLRKRNEDEPLGYFLICGEDQKFVPAEAVIEGHTIVVRAPEVKEPKAVRFAWTGIAEPNLCNTAGLPASPFRTDEYPLDSVDRNY